MKDLIFKTDKFRKVDNTLVSTLFWIHEDALLAYLREVNLYGFYVCITRYSEGEEISYSEITSDSSFELDA